ncbi:MgtC/SapB family protein [Legionella tunisiensis]|uniref:MgtC/SapB family protein n=1 Tax=Legionella tunisiensis TaxID=1034944 RepID=UPI000365A9AF|nr:MgtC/SapB family protein [Legionella tunisiensis]
MAILCLIFFSPLLFALQTKSNLSEYSVLIGGRDTHAELIYAFRLVVATILGAMIGLFHQREQGIGPLMYAAIASSSAVFGAAMLHGSLTWNNPYFMSGIAGLVTGIGFIGGSIIFRNEQRLMGMITAITMWGTVGVGLSCALGMHIIAAFSAVIISVFNFIPQRLQKKQLQE